MPQARPKALVAFTNHDDVITEIVSYDGTYDLERKGYRRAVDITAHPEIKVGWVLRDGGWYDPKAKKEGE